MDAIIAKLKAVQASADNRVTVSYTDDNVIITVFVDDGSVFSMVVKDAVLLNDIALSTLPQMEKTTKTLPAGKA